MKIIAPNFLTATEGIDLKSRIILEANAPDSYRDGPKMASGSSGQARKSNFLRPLR
ncbi:MAG: hypothetical protein JNM00_03710 [Flavobacteriales bacterium]|nr:hypothetical protein [Flavobacteriales bacterium]